MIQENKRLVNCFFRRWPSYVYEISPVAAYPPRHKSASHFRCCGSKPFEPGEYRHTFATDPRHRPSGYCAVRYSAGTGTLVPPVSRPSKLLAVSDASGGLSPEKPRFSRRFSGGHLAAVPVNPPVFSFRFSLLLPKSVVQAALSGATARPRFSTRYVVQPASPVYFPESMRPESDRLLFAKYILFSFSASHLPIRYQTTDGTGSQQLQSRKS